MPNLKSDYTLPLGVGLVSIGLLSNSWREWDLDPFVGIRVGIKIRVGRWGVAGVEILKRLILILGLN
jgi:hypothetical protein